MTEVWSRGWEITAWRMPLSQLTEEFAAAGFVIERLVEPQPATAMEASHPETFQEVVDRAGLHHLPFSQEASRRLLRMSAHRLVRWRLTRSSLPRTSLVDLARSTVDSR